MNIHDVVEPRDICWHRGKIQREKRRTLSKNVSKPNPPPKKKPNKHTQVIWSVP